VDGPPPGIVNASREDMMKLASADFANGGTIPMRFTADGDNVSPALAWHGAPEEAKSFALIVEDPDAPSGLFTHWTIWDIAPTTTRLDEEIVDIPMVNKMKQGENDFSRIGWGGPSPPRGHPHRYFFHLYALDEKLPLSPGATRDEVNRALAGHIIAEATMMARYGR
jgi:Raf kinase inhibitor-like YbhB/YbcL family protein